MLRINTYVWTWDQAEDSQVHVQVSGCVQTVLTYRLITTEWVQSQYWSAVQWGKTEGLNVRSYEVENCQHLVNDRVKVSVKYLITVSGNFFLQDHSDVLTNKAEMAKTVNMQTQIYF